jgi:hypothetical protein
MRKAFDACEKIAVQPDNFHIDEVLESLQKTRLGVTEVQKRICGMFLDKIESGVQY